MTTPALVGLLGLGAAPSATAAPAPAAGPALRSAAARSRLRSPGAAAVLGVVAAGPAHPAADPVQPSAAARDRRAGRGEGTYEGEETGQRGSIVFNVDPGRATASGGA